MYADFGPAGLMQTRNIAVFGPMQNPPAPAISVSAVYVDSSPAGRMAFAREVGIATVGNAGEAVEHPATVAVVRWGPRGGGEEALAHLRTAGRSVVVVAGRAALGRVECAREEGLLDSYLGLPASGPELRLFVATAVRQAAHDRTVAELTSALGAAERMAALAMLRGKALHDLANLTTLATMSVDRAQRFGGTVDLPELGEACHRMLKLHRRAREFHGSPSRCPQQYRLVDLVSTATDLVPMMADDRRANVRCPEDLVVWADRLETAYILATLVVACAPGDVDVSAHMDGRNAMVVLAGTGPARGDGVDLASSMIRGGGGALLAAMDGFVVRWPRFEGARQAA